MDISSMSLSPTNIAQLATNMSQEKTNDAVGVAVLKKAMDVQEQSAMQLVQAIPDASALPEGVGTRINVTA